MGRLRPNLASGKVLKPSEVRKHVPQADTPSAPVAKRPKLEEKETEVTLGEPSHRGLEALVYPFTAKDFITRFYEKSQPVLIERAYDELWNAKLIPSLATKSRLTSTLSAPTNRAYFHTDVQLMGYFKEDDDLFFETPAEGGAVAMEDVWRKLASKQNGSAPSLHISDMDLFAPDVQRLLTEVDNVWRGDGALASHVTVTPPGASDFGPHADGQGQFILQVRGSQHLTIYEAEGGPEAFIEAAGDEYAFPCYTHGPFPEVVLSMPLIEQVPSKTTQVVLRPGSTLFVPSTIKFSHVPSSQTEDSIALTIYLSPQPRWLPTLDSLLALASSGISEVDSCLNPPRLAGVSRLTTQDATQVQSDDEDEEDEEEQLDGPPEERDENWTLFPHNLDVQPTIDTSSGARMKQALVNVLDRAMQLAPAFVDSLMANVSLTRQDFLAHIPHLRKVIGAEGLEALLAKNGGLVKLSNFLPAEVAENIHRLISRVPEHDWQEAYASEDAKENNIEHAFHSARSFASHHAVFALFKRIMPELLGDFSMGRYTESHFIAPHDDRAYKEVNGDHFSRHIALIYYCSKDWKEEYGGQLLDMKTNKLYVPEFNSLIAFSVPRFHEVKPVLVPSVERFSIFGWFFKPGITYELYTGDN